MKSDTDRIIKSLAKTLVETLAETNPKYHVNVIEGFTREVYKMGKYNGKHLS